MPRADRGWPPNGKRAALALALLVVAGCFRFTGPASALHPAGRDSVVSWRVCDPPEQCSADVRLTYLGVAGFLIRSGNDAIVTAPSFTHPSVWAVATPFWPIHSDSAVVDRALRRALRNDLSALDSVRAILVGHAHYDHLMDVPLLARRYLPRATIYGSLTTKRILMGDSSLRAQSGRIDSLFPADSAVATAWHVGQWRYTSSRRMRFMALHSSHAPNWWFITLAPCHRERDRGSLPRTAWGWCLGEPLSYIIDLLDGRGRPVFRIFYQDAAAGPIDVVLPPFAGEDERRVDVAIVCAGNFKKVAEYPTLLLAALRPKYVILAHWEDFFEEQGSSPTPVRFTDTRELASRLDFMGPGRWTALVAGGVVNVDY